MVHRAGLGLTKGWVVVADIVAYSKKSEEQQRDVATYLIGTLEATHLYRTHLRRSEEYSIACTGDGFILVASDHAVGEAGAQLVLRFAEEVSALVRAYDQRLRFAVTEPNHPDARLEIRMAIHRGAFAFEPILGQRNAFGTGVNMACRIAGLGDAGHILLSRDAVRYIDATATLGPTQFVKYVCEAGVKHDTAVHVHTYWRGSAESDVFVGLASNTKAADRQRTVDSLVLGAIRRHLDRTLAYLQSCLKRSAPELGLRLTVLAPTAGRQYLAVTSYRQTDGESPTPASTVAYSVASGKPPEGVSAGAYVTNKPQWLIGLPDMHRDFAGYRNRLQAVGLDENTIREFRRPCRAFLAVPFDLPITPNARFVLALDSLDPLAEEDPPPFISDLVDNLQLAGSELGVLLELRHPRPRGQSSSQPEGGVSE